MFFSAVLCILYKFKDQFSTSVQLLIRLKLSGGPPVARMIFVAPVSKPDAAETAAPGLIHYFLRSHSRSQQLCSEGIKFISMPRRL